MLLRLSRGSTLHPTAVVDRGFGIKAARVAGRRGGIFAAVLRRAVGSGWRQTKDAFLGEGFIGVVRRNLADRIGRHAVASRYAIARDAAMLLDKIAARLVFVIDALDVGDEGVGFAIDFGGAGLAALYIRRTRRIRIQCR